MDNPIPSTYIDYLHTVPGVNADALAEALQTPPAVGIRVNRRKFSLLGISEIYPDSTGVEWCQSGVNLDRRPVFTLNPLLHAGAFYVQDASSMIYEQVMTTLRGKIARQSINILDFCAAPGGKTTAMINALNDTDIVVANEYVAARGKVLRENLQKWGFSNLITTGDSSDRYAVLPPVFDIIAVDAPCSGEGMMRKEEVARTQWSEKLVDDCASLQRDILSDLAVALRPGGYLIYSTCTFNLHENEENARYIRDTLGFTQIPINSLNLTGLDKIGRSLFPDIEALRFMPHLTPNGEGLFITVFQKPGIENPETSSAAVALAIDKKVDKKGKKKGKNSAKGNGNGSAETLSGDNLRWLKGVVKSGKEVDFEVTPAGVFAIPSSVIPMRTLLEQKGIHVTSSGVPAGELKGKNLIPDSRLVLSDLYDTASLPEVEVDEDMALSYLRRESFALPPNISKGYVVIKYKGVPLGLMKNLGNRANNLFHAPWRIKMQN